MRRLLPPLVLLLALAGCGASKPTRGQLAKACGRRAAASLSPGFGGPGRRALQREVAAAASEYYLQTGRCSAG